MSLTAKDSGIILCEEPDRECLSSVRDYRLPSVTACPWAAAQGNVKIRTVMGELYLNVLSDTGSIPVRSTRLCISELCIRHIVFRQTLLRICFYNGR